MWCGPRTTGKKGSRRFTIEVTASLSATVHKPQPKRCFQAQLLVARAAAKKKAARLPSPISLNETFAGATCRLSVWCGVAGRLLKRGCSWFLVGWVDDDQIHGWFTIKAENRGRIWHWIFFYTFKSSFKSGLNFLLWSSLMMCRISFGLEANSKCRSLIEVSECKIDCKSK